MRQDFERLFVHLYPVEPSASLLGQIMSNIHKEQTRFAAKQRVLVFGLGFVCSLVALVLSFKFMLSGMVESGFTDFASLFFTDFSSMAAYWQNYVLTLLESVPIISVAVFLAAAAALLEFLKLLFRDVKNILTSASVHKHQLV